MKLHAGLQSHQTGFCGSITSVVQMKESTLALLRIIWAKPTALATCQSEVHHLHNPVCLDLFSLGQFETVSLKDMATNTHILYHKTKIIYRSFIY